MRALRFGSYSMCATLAGTPSLSCRRKSISRYARLWPPPLCPAVQRPDQRLLRLRAGDLGEVGDARATTPRRRRLVLANAHLLRSPLGLFIAGSGGRTAEDLDRLAL